MNLGEIKTDVYARGFESDQAARIVTFANVVQRRVLAQHRWTFMLASANVAAVVGTSTYNLPAGVHHIESIRLTTPGQSYVEMEATDADTLLERVAYDDGSPFVEGTEAAWSSTTPTTFQVYPAPVYAGTFTVRYIGLPPALAADGDVPVIPVPYHDILVSGICELLSKRTRQWDAADRYKTETEDRIREMKGQLALKHRQSVTRVARSGRRD